MSPRKVLARVEMLRQGLYKTRHGRESAAQRAPLGGNGTQIAPGTNRRGNLCFFEGVPLEISKGDTGEADPKTRNTESNPSKGRASSKATSRTEHVMCKIYVQRCTGRSDCTAEHSSSTDRMSSSWKAARSHKHLEGGGC